MYLVKSSPSGIFTQRPSWSQAIALGITSSALFPKLYVNILGFTVWISIKVWISGNPIPAVL